MCPGKHYEHYNEGGCVASFSPSGTGEWEGFRKYFAATESTMTVYLNQEATAFNTWSSTLAVKRFSRSAAAGVGETYAIPDNVTIGCIPYKELHTGYFNDAVRSINNNASILPNTTLIMMCDMAERRSFFKRFSGAC